MSRDSKRLEKSSNKWLNSGSALIQRMKMQLSLFPVLPGSAEAQGDIVKCHLTAYFISSISAKYIKIRSRVKVIAR